MKISIHNVIAMDKKIYAIIGMAGSGKSEVITYLQEKFGWPKVYFGEATFDRIKQEGWEVNYENEKIARETIRKELGMGAYAMLSLPKIEKYMETSEVVLLESLYSWAEYKIIKEKFGSAFKAIAVYASPDTRFSRLLKRKNWRPVEDRAEFDRRDWTEIEGTDKGGPIAIADYTIMNEGTLDEFQTGIEYVLLKEHLIKK